ncbi:DUF488 domain-containing protein [Flavobacterium collinsii]|uniref:DUF488 domain-containing protein n=1 Tax=Flavobacterium collinsii TaxID=1114861 RepID=UPI002491CBBB|nr:DUF488 domain-containing protein [Flavobacterium collinsii]
MNQSTIYSIGHGNKTLEKFIEELLAYKIEYLFDVRSKPYSKFNPHFNKDLLELELTQNGITYIYAGDYLGGLPNDISCYVKGKVDYEKVKEKDFFQIGINTIVEANLEKVIIALMCSESKPETCHRSKLIGQELLKHNISVNHIINVNLIKGQEKVMDKLTQGKNLTNLFGDENLTSRKKY